MAAAGYRCKGQQDLRPYVLGVITGARYLSRPPPSEAAPPGSRDCLSLSAGNRARLRLSHLLAVRTATHPP
jgi:hypothetical protein